MTYSDDFGEEEKMGCYNINILRNNKNILQV